MNIRDLRYVVAVAEECHFGRAATKCHISQPALSGQIRKLENVLGVALFERTNRAVHITPIGEQIVAQARRLIVISEEITATAEAARDPFSGHFRLGMIATIGPYLSPLVLPAIRTEIPNLSLTLVEGMTSDLESRVATGELDGAILATPQEDQHLDHIDLYDEPFWIALPRRHPLAKRRTIDLSRIDHRELLLLADGHCLRDQIVDACHAATGITNANTRETSLATLLALVAAGDGVTLIPALALPATRAAPTGMATRREAANKAGRRVNLVCRASYPRTQLVNRLAQIIRAQVPGDLVTPLGNP